jgi:hypothetical protein
MNIVDKTNMSSQSYIPRRDVSQIDTIIVHHSGSDIDSLKSINIYHREKFKAGGIVYHYVVDRDGNIYKTRDLSHHTPHTKNHNKKGIGICFLGDHSNQLKISNPVEIIDRIIDDFIEFTKISKIYGHSELVSTICPGQLLNSVKVIRNTAFFSQKIN